MSDNWKDKIKNTEVNPPGDGWNGIAASLDESLNGLKFPVSLYNHEVDPPAAVWNNIESALDEKTEPLKRPFLIPPILKYAIAACFILVLSYAGIKFFTTDSIQVDTAIQERKGKKSTDSAIKVPPLSNTPAAQTGLDSDEQALEQYRQTYAKLDISGHHFSSQIEKNLYASPVQPYSEYATASFIKMPELQYSHRAAVNDSPASEADRYMMYKNSEGQFIRISKKLSTLYCCVSGEEQDNNCSDQLKKWREKLAASAFIPSPDNFMGILDLVNSLGDNHN